MKFKVGDKVEVITKTSGGPNVGEQFTVTVADESYIGFIWEYKGYPEISNGRRTNWGISCFKLVEENMNQEIEVGDIINGQAYKNNEVVAVKPTYYVVFNLAEKGEGSYNEFYIQKSAAVLVSKAIKQEIVGYELLKDLPGIPAGKVYTEENNKKGWFNSNGLSYYQRLPLSQVQDTTWFKPIYKAKEVVIDLTKNTHGYRQAIVKSDKVIFKYFSPATESVEVSFGDLTKLVNLLTPPVKVLSFKVEVSVIKVGCQEFTKEDIQSVHQAIQNLK